MSKKKNADDVTMVDRAANERRFQMVKGEPKQTRPLGKKPATYDHRDLHFAHFRTPELPHVPAQFGHENLVKKWGMLGNDQFGDCVFAGGAHETMLFNAERGARVSFDDAAVLSDYSAVTGFDPKDPENTDNGTNVRDALKYRRTTGLVDAQGTRHKLGAFVALEPGNWDHLRMALYLFGAVAIGVEFPPAAMDQFDHHQPWSVVHGAASRPEGGHYVPVVAFRNDELVAVTWGEPQPMTKAFYMKYCDEAYALLSLEALKDGHSLEGFDLPALLTALRSL